MSSQVFRLKPFPGFECMPTLNVSGSIARFDGTLAIRYELRGALSELIIPQPQTIPARKNRLWESTCFELFFAVEGCPGYWEFNLSPDNHWNVYSFTAYREGMEENASFLSLPFKVERRLNSLSVELNLSLNAIIKGHELLEAGICAVVKSTTDDISHWALTHPGLQADFHRRDSFAVRL